MNLTSMSFDDITEYLEGGGAFEAETGSMKLRMWGAGAGCFNVLLSPSAGMPAATSAYGLANILSTMTTYADLSAWTKAE